MVSDGNWFLTCFPKAHVSPRLTSMHSRYKTVGLAGVMKDKLSTHVVSITDKDAVTALPEQVISKHGSVDGVINNAGIIRHFVRVNDLDYDAIEKVMNVNFYGTLYMTKKSAPLSHATRSAYYQHLEHGRVFAGAGTNHLWGSKGGGQTIHGRLTL